MFNTKIGILRAAHIGNLTDLETAFTRDTPFYTQDHFSYTINAPSQEVTHHLLKIQSKYLLSDTHILRFKYGGQINNRKEFDIRRGGRTNIPALSLELLSHSAEIVYNGEFTNSLLLKSGIQLNYTDNTNDPETGILPLIPNYNSTQSSVFTILQKEHDELLYEIGARYDLRNVDVVAISNTLPREIERIKHVFHKHAFSGGIKWEANPNLKTHLNAGYMLRAPEVNELYSSGLHQGVSGIEEGRRDLQSEKSFKAILSAQWSLQQKLFVQAMAYYQTYQ